MSQTLPRRMMADAFLHWDLDQPGARHERIDGAPRAMAGAGRRPDRIVVNGLREFGLRIGGRCEVFTADIAVRMPNGNVRRPDIGIDCGPLVDPAAPEVILWSRDAARAWRHDVIEGLAATIALPALGLALPLADLYRHVVFPPGPEAQPA